MPDVDWLNSLGLIFGTGFGLKLVEWGYARWRQTQIAKGKRESQLQRWKVAAITWEGVAHRCRSIALEHGAPLDQLKELFEGVPSTFDD